MLGIMINVITAPGETFETIVKDFNWKQALLPIGLLMGLAVVSGFVLQELIADLQWEQIQKSIEGNAQIPEERKEEILSSQYDQVYSKTGGRAIFTYLSMAISWPIRIVFFTLFVKGFSIQRSYTRVKLRIIEYVFYYSIPLFLCVKFS